MLVSVNLAPIMLYALFCLHKYATSRKQPGNSSALRNLLRIGILDQLMGGIAVSMFVCSETLNIPFLGYFAALVLQLHCIVFTYMFYFALLVTFPQSMVRKSTRAKSGVKPRVYGPTENPPSVAHASLQMESMTPTELFI